MRAILTVFAKEFRENLRERRTLFTALLLGPLLGPLLFAGGLSLRLERGAEEGERPLALAVAHAERAPELLAFLRQYGVAVTPVDYDARQARAAVRAQRYSRVLLVPADFASHLAAGGPAPLELYADSSEIAAAGDAARLHALLANTPACWRGCASRRAASIRSCCRRSPCSRSTSRRRRPARCSSSVR